jgi:hypothetical protein
MPGNVKWRIIKKFLIIFFHEEHSNQYNFVIQVTGRDNWETIVNFEPTSNYQYHHSNRQYHHSIRHL